MFHATSGYGCAFFLFLDRPYSVVVLVLVVVAAGDGFGRGRRRRWRRGESDWSSPTFAVTGPVDVFLDPVLLLFFFLLLVLAPLPAS